MRLDPGLTRAETFAALMDEARAAWGEDELAQLRPALEITADALWRVAQQHLEMVDPGPWRE